MHMDWRSYCHYTPEVAHLHSQTAWDDDTWQAKYRGPAVEERELSLRFN